MSNISSYAQNAYFISFKQESYLKKCETKAFKKPNQEIAISIESTLWHQRSNGRWLSLVPVPAGRVWERIPRLSNSKGLPEDSLVVLSCLALSSFSCSSPLKQYFQWEVRGGKDLIWACWRLKPHFRDHLGSYFYCLKVRRVGWLRYYLLSFLAGTS